MESPDREVPLFMLCYRLYAKSKKLETHSLSTKDSLPTRDTSMPPGRQANAPCMMYEPRMAADSKEHGRRVVYRSFLIWR